MKKLIFLIGYLGFVYLAAQKGCAIEVTAATVCALIWSYLPSRMYRIVFYQHGKQVQISPMDTWFKCQAFAAVYRTKGMGRSAKVVNATKTFTNVRTEAA